MCSIGLMAKLKGGTCVVASKAEFVLCCSFCRKRSTLGVPERRLHVALEPLHPLSKLCIEPAACMRHCCRTQSLRGYCADQWLNAVRRESVPAGRCNTNGMVAPLWAELAMRIVLLGGRIGGGTAGTD